MARAFDLHDAALFLVARGEIVDEFKQAVRYRADLTVSPEVHDLLEAFDSFLDDRKPGNVTLINNAGTVSPIASADRSDPGEVDAAIRLNLLTPMWLTSGFIKTIEKRKLSGRVINISSGAAHSAYAGWSTYCAAKAGLDHFTRCVGIEQSDRVNPVTVVSIAPGVIDTDMQSQIRGMNKQDFPMLDKFVNLKESGALESADRVASRLVAFLDDGALKHGGIYDLRDL